MKVLVVGAMGRFAGMVVPELAKRGATVLGLIRDAGKREAMHAAGAAEAGVGFERCGQPASRAAGVDGVFHIGPGLPRTKQRWVCGWWKRRRRRE